MLLPAQHALKTHLVLQADYRQTSCVARDTVKPKVSDTRYCCGRRQRLRRNNVALESSSVQPRTVASTSTLRDFLKFTGGKSINTRAPMAKGVSALACFCCQLGAQMAPQGASAIGTCLSPPRVSRTVSLQNALILRTGTVGQTKRGRKIRQ